MQSSDIVHLAVGLGSFLLLYLVLLALDERVLDRRR